MYDSERMDEALSRPDSSGKTQPQRTAYEPPEILFAEDMTAQCNVCSGQDFKDAGGCAIPSS